MKPLIFFLTMIMIACNDNGSQGVNQADSTGASKTQKDSTGRIDNSDGKAVDKEPASGKTYSNARFRNVTVESIGNDSFRISGEAQIFEASFGWVVEDGHNELKQGFATTDMGAPEWGKFDFTIEAKKERPNSTLHIILFETSMKDGSRQFELPVRLY